MKKRLLATLLATTLCASSIGLAACGSDKNENELWITFYNGGYGSEWVEQLARKFEAENEGVTVHTDADTQLIDAVPNMMENGTDYDLIFCHNVAWEDFVSRGWIYNLDGLYSTVVDDKGTTFADRIWDEDVLASASYNGHYYKVPWTIGTAGIAYNLTVMDRIDTWLAGTKGQEYLQTEQGGGDTTRRWNRTAPVDYYDLLQYCYDVVAANLRSDPDEPNSPIVTPFTWSGRSEQWQWDYALFDWWGQLAGPETVNSFKNFGNVKDAANGDFTLDTNNVKNPDVNVYNPDKAAVVRNEDGTVNKSASTYIGWKEFQQAYTLWYDLVCGHHAWSSELIGSYGKFENEQAFTSGLAAMTPAACWIEYESRRYLDDYGQEISLMPTPIISNVVLDANGKVLPKGSAVPEGGQVLDAIHADAGVTEKTLVVNGNRYNRVSFTSSFGDSAMIPASSTGRDLAVKFLLFMQEEENAKLFTKLSGGTILPYKYEYWNSFVDENGVDHASAWQKSIFEIDQNSTKFNNYTQHPMMRKTKLKGLEKMTTIWPNNDYYYYKAWSATEGDTTNTPSELIKTRFDYVSGLWDTYKMNY